MDRIGIAKACVFPTVGLYLDARDGNDQALAAARAYPGRVLPYAVVDPRWTAAACQAELERCWDAGIWGVKLHTQLSDYPFDGPGYQPVFRFVDRHRLPLISHGVGSPATLRRVARAHPGAHFVVAHAGANPPDVASGDDLFAVAGEEPNVYLDLASSAGRFGALATAVARIGPGKLLYGSDMPWMCASYQIGRVLLAPLTEEDKRAVLGVTMTALLGTRQR
jgi:predicted TIM-barrel fold metal-dependent hydrolase